MTSVVMKNLVTCILALVLGVTSIGLASARGQTHVGGQVVLCSGGRLITVTLDAAGQPIGPSHICPDMALGLLAALANAPVEFGPPDQPRGLHLVQAISQTAPAVEHLSRARAPPVLSEF